MTTPATVTDKPLNQTQVKNLSEIVAGDFADLSAKVRKEIRRRLRERIEQINAEHDADVLEDYRQRLRDSARQAEDGLRQVIADAAAQGIEVQPDRYSKVIKVEVDPGLMTQTGRDKAIKDAEMAATRLENAATAVLNREHRATKRTVLLQSLTSQGALEILRDLPDMDDMLGVVAAEMEMEAGAEIAALMTEEERAKALTAPEETA